MKRVSQMYTKIALERNRRAKNEKLLTYAKPPGESSAKVFTHDYLFHVPSNQKMLPKFKRQPPFARKLRFRFGELAWNALGWFLGQLQWPKVDDTHGVTWCELALSFELATGLNLPRGAKQCEALFGSREGGRQAEWANSQQTSHSDFLEHDIIRVVIKKAVRWQCRVCTRGCARYDKCKFMKFSCAGYPETPLQAMRRHRLESAAQKRVRNATISPATLGEKAQVMSDLVRACAKFYQCFYGDPILTCKSLSALGLPKSAGLSRRPILPFQDLVRTELEACAADLPIRLRETEACNSTKMASWSSHWTPYVISRPASLWHPPSNH